MQFYDEDVYKSILFKRNIHTDLMSKALNDVKRYIIQNNRILVGGMAIELALRSKGSYLYTEESLADYDFISYDFNKDSYNIANILSSKYPDSIIDIINALHTSTLRVYMNSQEAADITYIPKDIYDKIPTIKYGGFRVVHPHYQVIDQHVSLGIPYNLRFKETILGRWEKDMTRHNLITTAFPIQLPKTISSDMKTISNKKFKISMKMLVDECVGGFAAINYWLNRAKLLDPSFKLDVTNNQSFRIDKGEIILNIPVLSIYSDDFIGLSKKFIKKCKNKYKPKYFNSLLEKIPRCVRLGNIDIYDNLGKRRSAYTDSNGISYANLQVIMTHMLVEWVINKKIEYLHGYHMARFMVLWAGEKYLNEKDPRKHGNYMLFLPHYKVYGKYEWHNSYIIKRKKIIHALQKNKEPLDLGIPKRLNHKNLTNEKKVAKLIEFIPSESPLYKFSGDESKEPFVETKLPS